MPRYRIVFMGSPDFAIPALDRLAGRHHICAVYTQPAKPSGRGMKPTPVPLAAYADSNNLPLFTPASLRGEDVQQELGTHQADFFVVVAYGLLLPKAVLALPRLGCINGHASLLPRWRGAAPIQRAIAAGDQTTGMSAMLMDEGLDTGIVLARRPCSIDANDTAGSLHDKLAALNASLLDDVIMDFDNRLKTAEPQDHDAASYAAKITSQDAEIDWTRTTADLDCHIRAYTPFPGAWCHGPKGRLRILAAHPAASAPEGPPGTIIKADNRALHIAAGDGALVIDQLQPAGKKPMAAADFLNGQALTVGQPLAANPQ
jgi:methionyl-tRNA formyltransferase